MCGFLATMGCEGKIRFNVSLSLKQIVSLDCKYNYKKIFLFLKTIFFISETHHGIAAM